MCYNNYDDDGKERINVCKAEEDMMLESKEEGKAEERQNSAANLREMGMTEEQIKQALKQRN